jgi:hypothetical protein
MTLIDIILILGLGWVMGEFYTIYKLRKNLRSVIIIQEEVPRPNVFKLETEEVDNTILLYDRDTNDFICQVHLRHFCSGRLIQISHRMLKGRLTYKVVL